MVSVGAVLSKNAAFEVCPGDRREWDRLLRQAGKLSLEQSWQYGEAVAALHGSEVRRRVIRCDDGPVAMVQGFRTRDLRIGSINRILRGPVWLGELSAANRTEICRLIRREFHERVTDLLFWLPDLPDTVESMRLMKSLGMRRMVTGYSTVWLDLRPDEDCLLDALHGKWRNSLRAAEKAGLRIKTADRDHAFEDAMAAYDLFRRKQRYIGPPGDLIRHIRNASGGSDKSGGVRVWNAIHDSAPVAGIAVVCHGASATYLAAWTSRDGRQRNAHNLLLWHAITELRKNGTDWLDLGGVDTQSSPGLARFKLGLGGELETQSGTYL
jgi:hypothetical protein